MTNKYRNHQSYYGTKYVRFDEFIKSRMMEKLIIFSIACTHLVYYFAVEIY